MTPQLLAVPQEATPRALRDVRTGAPLSPEDAAARISAYVYGNMVVLAALASLDLDAMTSGHAALVVAGVAASTFLAHAVADGIGRRLRSPLPRCPEFETNGPLRPDTGCSRCRGDSDQSRPWTLSPSTRLVRSPVKGDGLCPTGAPWRGTRGSSGTPPSAAGSGLPSQGSRVTALLLVPGQKIGCWALTVRGRLRWRGRRRTLSGRHRCRGAAGS